MDLQVQKWEDFDICDRKTEDYDYMKDEKFSAQAGIKAYIYISADDYYKLYINGRFVCQGPAAGYEFHYYYNKVDITDFLKDGENTVAVHTYYQGLINRVWLSGDDRHGLIMDVVQGGELLLCSDENFKYAYHSGFEAIGEFGYHTQFAQKYISGTEHENFESISYNDSGWKNARVRKHLDYSLYEQQSKMLEFEEVVPVAIQKDSKGMTVDFGGMYVGYLCANANGEQEQLIELLFGQELRGFSKVMLFGAYPILAGLKRLGKTELMYECLKDEGAWKRMLREGATSTFEGWGKDSKFCACNGLRYC